MASRLKTQSYVLVMVLVMFVLGDAKVQNEPEYCYVCENCPPFGEGSSRRCEREEQFKVRCMKQVGETVDEVYRTCSTDVTCDRLESSQPCRNKDDTNCYTCCVDELCNHVKKVSSSNFLVFTVLIVSLYSLLY